MEVVPLAARPEEETVGEGADMGVAAASDDEQVGEIEQYIRTTKERTRGIWNTLPFKKIPARMIIEMVKGSVSWLNMPPMGSITIDQFK